MQNDHILLGHGSGGKLSHDLISRTILDYFTDPELGKLDDAAVIDREEGLLAFSTDSYVVDPIVFPGGDIGKIAVCGTVNDLAMLGAVPLCMSVALIIEEGLPMAQLRQILNSMKQMASEAGIRIVTGDTKVVPHGAADKIFINTAGIGRIPDHISLGGHNAKPGDVIIINGPIGDHGITIMASREGLEMDVDLKTDSAPLNGLVSEILARPQKVHVLRDPTRGGVATTLCEIASQSAVGIKLYENRLPVSSGVRSACEILGLDPLYMANEGKCLVFCPAEAADEVLQTMRKNKYGKYATVIGEVHSDKPGRVSMETAIGGERILDMLSGEQLPRIC